jgi:outer membrane biogenesis lipoprotein LolB
MKFLILVIPLLAGCVTEAQYRANMDRQLEEIRQSRAGTYTGSSYVDRIRAEGDLDRAVNRLKWYHGRTR